MRHPMSLHARRELLKATAERYQKSSKKEKQIILDEFAASTGYHRKYAIQLLKHYTPGPDDKKSKSENRELVNIRMTCKPHW